MSIFISFQLSLVSMDLLLLQTFYKYRAKKHLLAHWSPYWPNPKVHGIEGKKIRISCLELNILGFGFYKTIEGMFGP